MPRPRRRRWRGRLQRPTTRIRRRECRPTSFRPPSPPRPSKHPGLRRRPSPGPPIQPPRPMCPSYRNRHPPRTSRRLQPATLLLQPQSPRPMWSTR
jgi:hypothetical protein